MSKNTITLEIDNLDKLNATLTNIGSRAVSKLKKSARQDITEVMDQSIQQVPVDTGTLKSSHYIEEVANGFEFGYGGAHAQENPKTNQMSSEYQLYVHERLDVQHTVGKAKFLEDPVNAYGERMEESLMSKMKGWFKNL